MDAVEYKHVVLGLVFLKYIFDTFDEHHAKLVAGKGEYAGANPEDQDEHKAENVFWVLPAARWTYLQNRAKRKPWLLSAAGGRGRISRVNGVNI